LLVEEQDAVDVAEPELRADEGEFDADTLGSPSLLFVLAERIDVKQALTAADGWGGDQYVAFERGDNVCVRLDYRGDTSRDVDEMRSALRQWIAEGPAGVANVRNHGEGLRFESCDAGRRAVDGNGGSGAALDLATGRTVLATQSLEQGADADQARCLADGVIEEFTSEELTTTGGPGADQLERIQAVAQGCA
jgi:hypothetical protein